MSELTPNIHKIITLLQTFLSFHRKLFLNKERELYSHWIFFG